MSDARQENINAVKDASQDESRASRASTRSDTWMLSAGNRPRLAARKKKVL